MAEQAAAHAPLPKNYQLVHDIVMQSGRGRHLTMTDVFSRAAELRPGIGFSTIYRGLVRLRDLGLIAEIVLPGGESATYEPIGAAHAHVRCTACGTIDDVSYALPVRVLRAVAAQTGYAVDDGNVTFSGRCARCREAMPAQAAHSA